MIFNGGGGGGGGGGREFLFHFQYYMYIGVSSYSLGLEIYAKTWHILKITLSRGCKRLHVFLAKDI